MFSKRILDFIGALFLLIMLSPLFAVIAVVFLVVAMVTGRGPVVMP